MLYFVMLKTTKDDQQFRTKNQQGKCSIKSFNFKMAVHNVYPLKLIQLTKHMSYCILNIYNVYCATQYNAVFVIFFYVEENFTSVVGNFETKKIAPN